MSTQLYRIEYWINDGSHRHYMVWGNPKTEEYALVRRNLLYKDKITEVTRYNVTKIGDKK